MAQFKWDSSYTVKVKRFDDDHQELFRILNSLHEGMLAGKGQQVLQKVLEQLLQYTEGHFAREEKVMREAGYPKLQTQIEQHRRFTDKIRDVTAKYKAGSLGITVDLLDFLTDWLKNHIVGVDKQYSDFLNSHGIA